MTVREFARAPAEGQSEGYKYNYALGQQEGARAFRARSAAILTAPEAAGRIDLAIHLAVQTDMSAEDAIAVLRATPKAAADGVRPGQAFYESIVANTKAGADEQSGVGSRFVRESHERFRNR